MTAVMIQMKGGQFSSSHCTKTLITPEQSTYKSPPFMRGFCLFPFKIVVGDKAVFLFDFVVIIFNSVNRTGNNLELILLQHNNDIINAVLTHIPL